MSWMEFTTQSRTISAWLSQFMWDWMAPAWRCPTQEPKYQNEQCGTKPQSEVSSLQMNVYLILEDGKWNFYQRVLQEEGTFFEK